MIMSEAEALEKVEIIYLPLDSVKGINCDMVKGMTFKGKNKIFIVINSDRRAEEQEHALHHELAHVRLNHLNDSRAEEILESEVEKLMLSEEKERKEISSSQAVKNRVVACSLCLS